MSTAPETPKHAGRTDVKSALDALTARLGSSAAASAEMAAVADAVDQLVIERTALASKLSAVSAQLEREQKKANLLDHASHVVNSSLDLDTVLRSVLDLAIDVMKAERGFVMLANDRHELELASMHNIEGNSLDSDDLKVSGSIVNRVYREGEPVITTDAQNDPRFSSQNSILSLHIRSIVCVPLKSKEHTIGVVYLDSRVMTGLFTRQDPELLLAVANQAAMAIENARLFKEQQARLNEIERLEAFQTRILSSITSGVITLDARNRITTFNEAAASTFGVDPATMVGRPISAMNSFVGGFSALIEHFTSAGRVGARFELEGTHPVSGTIVVELRVAPMGIHAESGIAVAVSDLTMQRALERQHDEEVARSKKIEESFSRYLAPHVVQSLMHDPDLVRLGGERQEATIMFADIRGFTAMSAEMSAENVVELLNAYLEEAVGVVFKHDGLLDKFYGDGLMAVFGPPRVRPDDAARAIKTAAMLHKAVRELNPSLSRPIEIGIGLATGEVVSGHIGSERRMDYTVIGDAVNLASRLQGVAPPGALYVDELTYAKSGLGWPAQKMSAKVKGRERAVTIYDLKV